MSKINSALLNLVRGGYQQLLEPLLSPGRTAGGRVEALRPLSLIGARLQQTDAKSPTGAESAGEFSYYPPFPGENSALRWAGKPFEELPIVHIKATYNNTHIQLTDPKGQYMARTSCGTEGFRNAKKSTPIAAQTAGVSAAAKAHEKGVSFVRVVIKGLGPGRFAAIKGLTLGGLEVVSITDNTPVPHNGCRPRKARRV